MIASAPTARRSTARRSTALGLLLGVTLLVGCSSQTAGSPDTADSTVVTSGPTGTPAPPSPTDPRTPGGPAPAFDADPETAVIRFSSTDAGVDGVRGVDETTVFGDGRISRDVGDSFSYQTGRLASSDDVQTLLDRAAELGLLAGPDPGEATISDSGWSDLTFTLADREVSIHVYAPGWTDGLPDEQRQVRENFTIFASELTDWSGVEVAEPLADTAPETVVLWAERVQPPEPSSGGDTNSDSEYQEITIDWPVRTSVRDAFGDDGCWTATGDDAAAIVAAMKANEQVIEQLPDNSRPQFVVDTGAKVPTRLIVSAEIFGRPCSPSERAGDLPEPWPGEDRRAADPWATWVGEDAVDRAADEGRFLPDGSTRARTSHYPLHFSMAEADGRTVVDVVGGPHPGGDRDPATFALRVDLETGKVLKLRTD